MRIHLRRYALWISVIIVSGGMISKLPNLLASRGVHGGGDPILLQPELRRDAMVLFLEACALVWLWQMRSKPSHQRWCIAVLGGMFAMYHVALTIANIPGPCPCFGSAWRLLGLSEGGGRVVAATLAWVLFCSGVVLLTGVWSGAAGRPESPLPRK